MGGHRGATFVLKGRHSDILADDTYAEMQERRPEIVTREIDCGHAPALNVDEQVRPIRELLES